MSSATRTMRHPQGRHVRGWRLGLTLVGLAGSGCSLDGMLKSDELPPGVSDPAIARTPEGALAAYNSAAALFRLAYGGHLAPAALGGNVGASQASFIGNTGLLSDELQSGDMPLNPGFGARADPEDIRDLPEGANDQSQHYAFAFSRLQRVRGQAGQAIGLLTRYRPADSALAGHLYALQGYAEVFLAELFCSGIPLSTLDYEGDYTLQPGSSTEAVFTHAVELFDSALALTDDSARFLDLARVGKARALLALGQYAAAAAAVAPVPDAYSYLATYSATGTTAARNFAAIAGTGLPTWKFTVADQEGGNGLDYRTSGDPRVQVAARGTGGGGATIWYPNKYLVGTAANGASSIVVASGVEARLIEAEAALQANPDDGVWLTKLNALRTTCVDAATCPTPAPAGSGGIVGLPPLDDPGSANPDARVDLLFRERAFWLFLTGHRQGDLRRLIRQYGRLQEQVYPTGPYPGLIIYGSDVTAPVPTAERILNPKFTRCISRTA